MLSGERKKTWKYNMWTTHIMDYNTSSVGPSHKQVIDFTHRFEMSRVRFPDLGKDIDFLERQS